MSIIYVLIPLAIILVGIAVLVFFWAVKSNQFEDLDRQGYSILFDDDIKKDERTDKKDSNKHGNKLGNKLGKTESNDKSEAEK